MASYSFGTTHAHSTSASPSFGLWSSNYGSFRQTSPFGNAIPFASQVGVQESKITASPFGSTCTCPLHEGFGSSNCGSSIQTPGAPFGTRASFLESKSTGSPSGSTITCPSYRGSSKPLNQAPIFGTSSVSATTPDSSLFGSTTTCPSFIGYNSPAFGTPQPLLQPFGSIGPPSSSFGVSAQPLFGPPSFSSGVSTKPGFQESKTPPLGVFTPSCFGRGPPSSIELATTSSLDFAGFGTPQPLIQPSGLKKSIFSTDKKGNFTPISGSLHTGATTQSPTLEFGLSQPPSFGPSFSFGFSDQPSFGPPSFSSGVSTTPTIGWKPPSSIGLTTTSSFDFAGCGRTVCDNSQRGSSIAPHCETQGIDGKLMSVSGTEIFRHKSHEELRWEDYNNFKNKGNSSSIPKTEIDGLRGCTCNCKCHQFNATPNKVATENTQGTNDTMNTFVNKNNQPFTAFSVPTFITFIHPNTPMFPSQYFGSTVASYTSPFGFNLNGVNGSNSPPLVPTESPIMGLHGGPSTGFINVSGPNSSEFNLNSINGSHSPLSVPVESPVIGVHGGAIDSRGPDDGNCSNGACPVFGSVGSPNTGCLGLGSNTTPLNEKIDAKVKASVKNPVLESPSTSISQRPVSGKEVEKWGHIPKGLEIIVEKSGFNPWLSQEVTDGNKDESEGGEILCCEEPDKDEDIIALAEFAVEQYNALHKDDKVVFRKVVVACLEAVKGGRYHLVVDAVVADSPKMHYAVVLHKATDRSNHMTVLEKWLPCKA